MVRLVEPPVACRPTTPLTIARSSITWPIGVNALPSAVSSSARLTPSGGQRVAKRRVRVDEGGARQMEAHDLHQHLIGVGGAVEGAGPRRVIGRRLGLQQIGARRPCLRRKAGGSSTSRRSGGRTASARPGGTPPADGRRPARRSRGPARSCRRPRDRRRRRTCRATARPRSRARSRRARTATAPCPPRPG